MVKIHCNAVGEMAVFSINGIREKKNIYQFLLHTVIQNTFKVNYRSEHGRWNNKASRIKEENIFIDVE